MDVLLEPCEVGEVCDQSEPGAAAAVWPASTTPLIKDPLKAEGDVLDPNETAC